MSETAVNPLRKMHEKVAEKQTGAEQKEVIIKEEIKDEKVDSKKEEILQPAETGGDVKETPKESVKKNEQEKVVSTSLFDFTFKEEKAEEEKVYDPSKPEEFIEMLKKRMGGGDVLGVMGKLDEIEEKDKKINELSIQTQAYEQLISNLSPDVYRIVDANATGKDYLQIIKQIAGNTLDFSKSANAYGKEEMIKLFNPELTDEDLEEMEEKSKGNLYKMSKDNYELRQKEYNKTSTDFMEGKRDYATNLLGSANQSMTDLYAKFPNIKKTELKSIEETVRQNALHKIFYDDKGYFQKDAMEKLVFGTHGLKVIDELKKEFQNTLKREKQKSESESAEKIFSETTKDKIDRKGADIQKLTPKEAVKIGMPFLQKKK